MRVETKTIKNLLIAYCPEIPVRFKYVETNNWVDSSDTLHVYIQSKNEEDRKTVTRVINSHSTGLKVYNGGSQTYATGFPEIKIINEKTGEELKVDSLFEFVCLHLLDE